MTYKLKEPQKETSDFQRLYLRDLHEREAEAIKPRARENLISYINHINRQTNNLSPGHYHQRIN